MTVANPAVLYWLVLGAIPILVYYLMRFRSLRVSWGADYILELALARRRRRLYLDQMILLALRALLVMAFVSAFARPRSRAVHSAATDGEVLRIVLADGSTSMLASEGGRSRRETAMAAMRDLVGGWGRGEQWSLYVMDEEPRWLVDRETVSNPEQSLAVLDALQTAETAISLAAGLEEVLAHGAGRPREIYLFTDDLASSWAGAEQVAAGVDEQTRIFWICPPLEDRRNVAVTGVQVSHEQVLRGYPFDVYAQVHNFSAETVRDVEVTFLLDGTASGAERISLPPGQTIRVRRELRVDEPGSHLVTVRTADDVLTADNAHSAGIMVSTAIGVRVLRDADRGGKFESSAAFLELAARVLGGGTEGPLQIDTFSAAECTAADLDGVAVTVLDGGRTLTPALAQELRRYVDGGGALVLACDETVALERWSQWLGPLDLLPAGLLGVRSQPLGGDTFRALSRSGFEAPALRALESGADGDITQVRFYSWTEFGPVGEPATVLARFDDGSPFAVGRRFAHGGVLLLAAGLNARNNNLLVRETFYPFLVHLFSEAASAGISPRRVGRREPVRYLAQEAPPPLAAQFTAEGIEPVTAVLSAHAQGVLVEVPGGAPHSGPASLLVLRENRQERIWYGVQGARTDSDLTPVSPALRAQLAARFGWSVAGDSAALAALLQADGRGMERYAWVLLAVLFLGFAELLMGLRFV